MNQQVKYLLHPLYGNIKDANISTKDPVKQKPKQQHVGTLKPKKVFTTAVAPPKTEIDKQNLKLSLHQWTPVQNLVFIVVESNTASQSAKNSRACSTKTRLSKGKVCVFHV